MAWDESKTWLVGSQNGKLYQSLLNEAMESPARKDSRPAAEPGAPKLSPW